jgi:hypothetical protein
LHKSRWKIGNKIKKGLDRNPPRKNPISYEKPLQKYPLLGMLQSFFNYKLFTLKAVKPYFFKKILKF